MSDSLQPHEWQHTRLPCPSPSSGICSDSCLLSQWCHPAISSSVVPFSSCLQSSPASESFPMSQLLTSGGQSFSFSISPSSEYSGLLYFRIDWFDLFVVQGTLQSSPAPQFENISFSALSVLYGKILTSVHYYWKNDSFDYMDSCRQSDVFDT